MIVVNRFYRTDSDNVFLPKLIAGEQKFDLVLTDPPYGLNKDFGNDSDKLELDDFLAINRARIAMCADLLSDSGSLVWFAIHHFVGFFQAMMYEKGLHYRRMNIWRYLNGFSRSSRAPRAEYEPFLWFSRSDKRWTYNADDLRTPYKSTERLKTPVFYRNGHGERTAWTPNPLGALRGDIWEYPTLAGKRFERERSGHPTQKPESLITDLIRAFCPKDSDGRYAGRILDPFSGSGTVGVCAERLNRKGHRIQWVCAELEQTWVDVSNKRLARLREQTDVFVAE